MVYTSVSNDIKESITNELKQSINATPVLIIRMSDHPDDDYLYLYVAKRNDGYVAGLANTSRGVCLYENHYNCTFKSAMEITTAKIKQCF